MKNNSYTENNRLLDAHQQAVLLEKAKAQLLREKAFAYREAQIEARIMKGKLCPLVNSESAAALSFRIEAAELK